MNRGKTLSIKDYLDEIKPYLSDIINDDETQAEWKIKLTMAINFFSSKDSEETRIMHSYSYNIEIMMGSEIDEITEEHQEGLEESMKGS